jgi:RNA polymerase sigma-70 factor (ECF subfamily)
MGTGSGAGFSDGHLPEAAGILPAELLRMEPAGERLAHLVRENLGWLQGWLRGRVGDPDLADDLCQEAFLRALRRVSKLRDPARFPAWLYRIAENTVRDHLRSVARRRNRVTYTDRLEEFDTSAPAVEDPARREAAERLLAAIRNLPARLRDPLLLRHSSDLSYAEIARVLGISENAVQVRIFRARKKLREECKELAE